MTDLDRIRTLLNCRRCQEVPILMETPFGCFVSVRRKTRCRQYKPGCYGTCKTAVTGTPEAAIALWNKMQSDD